MSIDDLPLVADYRKIVETALQRKGSSRDLLETVEAIRGIRQQDNITQDGSAHDSAVDSAVRRIFIGLIASLSTDELNYSQLWKLIDTANALADNELSEPGLGFYLIEELLDSQTIDGCRKVFDYLESRRERMVRKNFKSKHLVILRCCNELLRRLSRAEETVFCGRVFIYLFQTFPLGDRSSVNLRGVFHMENVTIYDETLQQSENAIKPMEIDEEDAQQLVSDSQIQSVTLPAPEKNARGNPPLRHPKGDSVESPPDLDALYPAFWSLQGLFSDPTRLFEEQSMKKFKDGMSATLSCFRHTARMSASATEPLISKRGTKRKRDNPDADGSSASTFNPKYLTSRDLFDLEIHDIAFRRNILVQALILIDFLLSLSPAGKLKSAGLSNKSILYAYTLSEDDTKWAQSMRLSIATYLQQSGIGSEGSLYYRMVDTVLSRDKNWARWKAENCPPISRPAVSEEVFVAAQKSLRQLGTSKSLPNPPGADELAFLSHVESLESLKHPSARHHAPTVQEYYKGIQGDALDLEMAMDEQEKSEIEEKKAGKLWRALRAATGKKFVLCEKIKNGENLGALVGDEAASRTNGEVDGEADHDVRSQHQDGEIKSTEEEATTHTESGSESEREAQTADTNDNHVTDGEATT